MNRRMNVSVKRILALSFALVFIIPLVCNIFVMIGERSIIKESIYDSNTALMNQISYVFESYLETVSVIGTQISQSEYLNATVKSGTDISAEKCAEISDFLKKYKVMSPIIQDICLYVNESDTVITTSFFGNSESFYKSGYKFREDDYSTWKTRFLDEYKYREFEESFKFDSVGPEKNIMAYTQSIPVDYSGEINGQLFVMLNCDDIIEIMSNRNIKNDASMYVINNYGNTLISTDETARIDMNVFKQIGNKLNGSFSARVNNKNIVVQYSKHSSLNHTYIIFTPEKVFLKKIKRLNILTLISYLICLLLGAMVIMFISNKTYTPIDNLVKQLAGDNRKHGINEFEIIRRDITEKYREVSELKKTLEREYLIKIMSGDYSDKDVRISGFEDKKDDGKFTFMNISVKKYDKNLFRNLDEEYDTVSFILLNVLSELLEGRYVVKCVSMESPDFLFIISDIELSDGSNSESTDEFVKAAEAIKKLMSSEFGTDIVVTLSEKHIGFAGFKKCYGEIKELKIFAVENSSMSVINYVECGKISGETNYFCLYSEQNENNLINLCKNSSKDKLSALLTSVFRENREVTANNTEFRRYLYYDIYGTYLRLAGELHIDERNAVKPPNYSDESTPDELSGYLIKLFCELCDEMERTGMNSNGICEDVKQYVKENYMCYDLGLEKIAEHFNLSPKYLSNLFKKTENIRLTDFISLVRMENAKKLLLSTRMSAAEVAGQVGYTSDMAFSRFFKKKEGVPPGVFRSINRN